jgi:hypothetical protein
MNCGRIEVSRERCAPLAAAVSPGNTPRKVTSMSTKVYVATLPECDICKYDGGKPGVEAHYDGKTINGPWANMCSAHFITHGVGLGTGRGQELVVGEDPATAESKRQDLLAAIAAGDFEAAEDIVGDGDIAEWL